MRNRGRISDTEAQRFRTSEQQKTRQAEQLKQRFAKYSRSPNRVAVPKAAWKRFVLIVLVLVMGTMLLKRVPQISTYFQTRQTKSPFPMTGAVRWFIPTPANGVNDMAPLTIAGLTEAGRHVVVRLDTWEAHAPIVMIPIRSGETATLQIPLGRYRITYALNASWQGDFSRLNGNLKTRRSSFF